MSTSESQKRASEKWRKKNSERFYAAQKRWQKKNPEKVKQYRKNWYYKNDENKKKAQEYTIHSKVCKILREHKENLNGDPERLSTDFIIGIVNAQHDQRMARITRK